MARAARTKPAQPASAPPPRQPLMPEGAGNPALVTPRHHPTAPQAFKLYEGHLTAECSLLFNGAPACPACLGRELQRGER
jgi:hypothetical protein